ncbi:hypothetical protein [Nocardia fluminea]
MAATDERTYAPIATPSSATAVKPTAMPMSAGNGSPMSGAQRMSCVV